MSDLPPLRDALFYVEQAEPNKYKIQSDQLEQIGARLRGPARFSIFNSIILPLIVSVATIVFSALFQYVSWQNSVRLQNANDISSRAADIYKEVDAAMSSRRFEGWQRSLVVLISVSASFCCALVSRLQSSILNPTYVASWHARLPDRVSVCRPRRRPT